MRFSASRIATYMDCPLRAHFKYDQLLPTKTNAKATFGSVVHHVLDQYHRNGNNVDAAVELFRHLWEHPEELGLDYGVWPKYTTYGSLREKGVEIIRNYHDRNKWDTVRVIATEHPFLVPFGDHELTGFVDHVQMKRSGRGKSTLRIIDYKTAGSAPTKVSLRLNVQFTVYTYASLQPEFFFGNGPDFPPLPDAEQLWDAAQKWDRKAIWFHLMTTKEIDAGPRDDGDFMRLYRVCNEIQKANAAKVFVPKIGEPCIFCDFNEQCGIEIPDRDELETETLL